MKKPVCYENYPAGTIMLAVALEISIYAIGTALLYSLSRVWMYAYIAYIIILQIRLLGGHCTKCYYYGKSCAFGKGRLSSLFFRKADAKSFSHMKITWKAMIPDILASFVPVVGGIWILFSRFSWMTLALILLLVFLSFAGNGFVRGNLACLHCKQRELGCPAERLFAGTKR